MMKPLRTALLILFRLAHHCSQNPTLLGYLPDGHYLGYCR